MAALALAIQLTRGALGRSALASRFVMHGPALPGQISGAVKPYERGERFMQGATMRLIVVAERNREGSLCLTSSTPPAVQVRV